MRSVAQEVSSGRLIPAFYTEVDDAGLSLCAEVLTNIGAGLDDAQLAGTLDFILDGVDQALREVLGLLAAQDAAADRRPGVGPETEGVSDADADGERDGATVIVLPEAPRPARAAGDSTDVAGAAEAAGGQSGQEGAQTPVATMQGVTGGTTIGTAAGMADATVEIAAVVDGPVPGVPSDAQGGTGAETTDTPKPLLVS